MMEDMQQPQSGGAAATILPRLPLDPRTSSNDEASGDLIAVTTAFRLIDLPMELKLKIFESLVPAPLPTGSRLPLSTDILTSREALANLCRTSKFYKKIVMPLMYSNIIITSRKQVAKLLANLLGNQERCAWMRSVAVLVDLVFEVFYEEDLAVLTLCRASPALSRFTLEEHGIQSQTGMVPKIIDECKRYIYQLYDDIHAAPRGLSRGDLHQEWCLRWLYFRLPRIILYLGNRIEDFLIAAPRDPHFGRYSLYRKASEDLHDLTSGQYSHTACQTLVGDTCKILRRVRTQPCARTGGDCEPLPLGIEFAKCQQWEFLLDEGCWWSLVDHNEWGAFRRQTWKRLNVFSHITVLSLYHSRTHPAWLRHCFRYAKHLEKLTYTTDPTGWNHNFVRRALTAEELDVTLQEALEEIRDTLTDLSLGWAPRGAVLTVEDQAAVARHRVDVSHFPRLKRVDIDVPFIYEDENDYEGDGNDQNHHAESSA